MFVTISCGNDGDELSVDGEYSHVRAEVTNFLIDHNHKVEAEED